MRLVAPPGQASGRSLRNVVIPLLRMGLQASCTASIKDFALGSAAGICGEAARINAQNPPSMIATGSVACHEPTVRGSGMASSFDNPNHNLFGSRGLRVREKAPTDIPTIDQLMRPPQPRPWWELLPPQPSSNDPSPYAPVPIIPPAPPPPRDVDPPSRPPEWLYGPPRISGVSIEPSSSSPAPRGLPALLAEIGAFEPSDPETPPTGGLPGLLREYLRNSRRHGY